MSVKSDTSLRQHHGDYGDYFTISGPVCHRRKKKQVVGKAIINFKILEKEELLTSEWRSVGEAQRRKYYDITSVGREILAKQTAEWQTFITKL